MQDLPSVLKEQIASKLDTVSARQLRRASGDLNQSVQETANGYADKLIQELWLDVVPGGDSEQRLSVVLEELTISDLAARDDIPFSCMQLFADAVCGKLTEEEMTISGLDVQSHSFLMGLLKAVNQGARHLTGLSVTYPAGTAGASTVKELWKSEALCELKITGPSQIAVESFAKDLPQAGAWTKKNLDSATFTRTYFRN